MINPFNYKNKEDFLKALDSNEFLKQILPVIRTVIRKYLNTSYTINYDQLTIAILTSLTTYLRTLWTGAHPNQAERAAVTTGRSLPQSVIVGNIITKDIKKPDEKISKTLEITSDLVSRASLSTLPDIPPNLKKNISDDIKVLLKIFTTLPNKNKTPTGSGKIETNINDLNTTWLDPGIDISNLNTDDVIKGSGWLGDLWNKGTEWVGDLWNGIWGTKVPETPPPTHLPSGGTLSTINMALQLGEKAIPLVGSLAEAGSDMWYNSIKDNDYTTNEDDGWFSSVKKGLGRNLQWYLPKIRDKIRTTRNLKNYYNLGENYEALSSAMKQVLPALAQDQYEYEDAYRRAAAQHNYEVSKRRTSIFTEPIAMAADIGIAKYLKKPAPAIKRAAKNLVNLINYKPLPKPFMPKFKYKYSTQALSHLPSIPKRPTTPKTELPLDITTENVYTPPPRPIHVNPTVIPQKRLRTNVVRIPRGSLRNNIKPVLVQPSPPTMKASRTRRTMKTRRK